MPRRQGNDGMELVYQDFEKISAAMERGLYDRVLFELIQRKENAFFDDGFLVEYATAGSVTVRSGLGFQTDNTQSDPEPSKRLLYNLSQSTHNIAAPDAALDRIDIVCVKAARAGTIQEVRKYKDAASGVVTNEQFYVQNDWRAETLIVAGVPHATPVAPATPAGYIKIAELHVAAVFGLSGALDVTDSRSLMPIAGEMLLNTLGFVRLTASSAIALSALLAEIDAQLKNPDFNFVEIEDLEADPAAPVKADYHRLYAKQGTLFIRSTGGTITPVGSGGGGGGGAVWSVPEGDGAIEAQENGERVLLFEAGLAQRAVLFVKVPQGYLTGRPIKLYIGQYSPSAGGTQLLTARTYLVRKNQDAISATANFQDSTNLAITNTVANQYREVQLDITDSLGRVNLFAVSPGDVLRVELSRGADTDTDDVRMVPSATEVTFS